MTYPQSSMIPAPRMSLPSTTPEKFVEFHAKSPDVYAVLVRLAREWILNTGRKRLGMKALFERARWEIAVSTSDPDWKLCNSYTPYYARLIMLQEPDLDGLFELRRSDADEWFANQPRCASCPHLWNLTHVDMPLTLGEEGKTEHWFSCRHPRCPCVVVAGELR